MIKRAVVFLLFTLAAAAFGIKFIDQGYYMGCLWMLLLWGVVVAFLGVRQLFRALRGAAVKFIKLQSGRF